MVYAILTFSEAQNDPTLFDPNSVVHLTHVESSSVLRVVADRQLPGDAVWKGGTQTQHVCKTEAVRREMGVQWKVILKAVHLWEETVISVIWLNSE